MSGSGKKKALPSRLLPIARCNSMNLMLAPTMAIIRGANSIPRRLADPRRVSKGYRQPHGPI
jgi:hypothetical protein